MNSDFTQIGDKLWLGGANVMYMMPYSFIKDNDIKLIINCAQEISYNTKQAYDTHHLKFPLMDVPGETLWPHIHIASRAIEDAHLNGKNVYVHCAMGISRSASVVIYHLMRISGLTFDQAYTIVKNKRGIIQPNEGFVRQLKDLEKKIVRK